MTSPTQRALKELRSRGWKVDVVEYWNGFAKRRKDLFRFGDLVAIDLNDCVNLYPSIKLLFKNKP